MGVALARSPRSKARESEGRTALLKVGDLLAGKYRVERLLGEGGMGVVVAAHHELLDQRVAVKLLYQDVADREAQSRLLLEARACAKLQSDHVARVIDVDTGADGLPFIVMELLEGSDLCQIADARGALPRWVVVDYVLQALEGLAHAHARGIVHRDLKPSNLFLANRGDGSQIIKILDFGISKSTEPTEGSGERQRAMQLTGGRAVLGSPPYMSPEQVRSPKTVDHRTDIWAIGIVMYELLTNSMPFGGQEVNETFAQILEKEPQPIRQLVNGVPEGLDAIVMRCLAKKRDDRFADVSELARALVPFGSGTWMQSAARVNATLTRGDDVASGPRISGPPSSTDRTDRIAIPGSPARRDSAQSELTGTARTVARRFNVLGKPARNLLALAGVIGVVAIVLIAGTAVQRSRAAASSAEPAPVATAPVTTTEAPHETAAAPTPVAVAATGALAPMAPFGSAAGAGGPDTEPSALALRQGTVGAAASTTPPTSSITPQTTSPTTGRKPATAAPTRPATGPGPTPRKPAFGAAPVKPSLPPGLPRERQ